jgi:arsenate reductase
MYTNIKSYLDVLANEFDSIASERKQILKKLANYIETKLDKSMPADLVYICTHNSRRSHFGQIWAKTSADYYGLNNIQTFSGGTEATAFHIHAINSLKRAGFVVKPLNDEKNTVYHVMYDNEKPPIVCFSKIYYDVQNPSKDFAAIMTCSDAEQNCPFIPGVELRIGTTYDDPKEFDNTPLQDAKYDERCKQIALETLYVFSLVKNSTLK